MMSRESGLWKFVMLLNAPPNRIYKSELKIARDITDMCFIKDVGEIYHVHGK